MYDIQAVNPPDDNFSIQDHINEQDIPDSPTNLLTLHSTCGRRVKASVCSTWDGTLFVYIEEWIKERGD